MESNVREGYEDVSVVSSLERKVSNGCRTVMVSPTLTPIWNLSFESHLLEAALQNVAVSIPKTESKDPFDGLASRLACDTRLALSTLLT